MNDKSHSLVGALAPVPGPGFFPPARDQNRLLMVGTPDALLVRLQVACVIEERLNSFYGIQPEDATLLHMIETDGEFDSDLINAIAAGLADDDLWAIAPVQRLYSRVLSHYYRV